MRVYTFGSIKHAYQFFKLQFLGLHHDAQELHQHYATEVPFHNQASFGVMTLAKDMIRQARQNYEVTDLAVQTWQNHHTVRMIEELILRKIALPGYQQTRAFLLNHSDLEFLEATKHSFWGCGHRSSELEKMTDSEIEQKCGRNEMGKVIKRVAICLTDGYKHRREGWTLIISCKFTARHCEARLRLFPCESVRRRVVFYASSFTSSTHLRV